MTKKRASSYRHLDKSNVLSLLKAIEQMYNLCQDVLNTYTQTSLMLSLAIESQMLVLKLRVMRERWHYHLPFKEACKVNFGDWSRKAKDMASSFADAEQEDMEPISEYCPSKHFLLDLYCLLPEVTTAEGYTPYYKETVMNRFIINQEQIRKQITERWTSYYKQRFSDHVASEIESSRSISLQPLSKGHETIRKACHDILTELSDELSALNDLREPEIQRDQFARLADRVFAESDYDGRKARMSAKQDVNAWKNKTPKHLKEKSREGEIETSINIINNDLKHGSKLADYIGEELDIKDNSAGVGQFLHHVRADIPVDELNDLIEQLYRIRLFREDKEQEEARNATQPDVAPAPTHSQPEPPTSGQQPQRPVLPYFFKTDFAENPVAVSAFYDLLHLIGPYISSRESDNPYRQWKWSHLRVAWGKAGLINKDTPKQHFAEFIHDVFPDVTVGSVIRSLQRYHETDIGFDRIANDIVKAFEEEA